MICVKVRGAQFGSVFTKGEDMPDIEDKYDCYADFEGPSEETEEEARRRVHDSHIRGHSQRSPQGSYSNIIGTPRHAKHRGGRIHGVTIK